MDRVGLDLVGQGRTGWTGLDLVGLGCTGLDTSTCSVAVVDTSTLASCVPCLAHLRCTVELITTKIVSRIISSN